MKAEFIQADQIEEMDSAESSLITEYKDPEPYSPIATELKELSELASSGNGVSRLSVPRDVRRQRVVSAFHDAFELIGGVPRLAHWGDSHPTDFFKLYARLLPAEAGQHITHDGEIRVIHAIPRGPLDV